MISTRSSRLAVCALALAAAVLNAQPRPGDVFREYMWYNRSGDAGGALRVGGSNSATYPDRQIVGDHWVTQWIELDHDLDLEDAVRAEAVVEKILCHDNTRGLAFQINDSGWIAVPEAEAIPYPQWAYQHHIYPSVPIPLQHIRGNGNSFRMRVEKSHPWNWPQNLIYGFHFRIYYDADSKPHPEAKLISPEPGSTAGRQVEFRCSASSANGDIERVDYLGLYEDVNYEGDGCYRQWHYHYFHGDLVHHLGRQTRPPFRLLWDTSWVPDQGEPMEFAARVTDATGMTVMTAAAGDVVLQRDGLSVELCKPYEVPRTWVTRKAVLAEKFAIKGDLSKAVAYQLVWASWSPGYMNGILINGIEVFGSEGPNYKYYAHRVELEDVSVLEPGENELATGKTPKINGQTVHGMEVEYPGIMVLVQYEQQASVSASPKPKCFTLHQNYPNPFNAATRIRFHLAREAEVSLAVCNLRGEKVRNLIDGRMEPGAHVAVWDGRDDLGMILTSGLYFCVLRARDFCAAGKMVYIR